jgi:precorrin-2 methylase
MLSSNERPFDKLRFTVENSIRRRTTKLSVIVLLLAAVAVALVLLPGSSTQMSSVHAQGPPAQSKAARKKLRNFDAQILANANELLEEGRNTFRFDTFGDEVFWGGALQLHQAIKGATLGGVGPGITPSTALSLGLKVDLDALPRPLINQLRQGKINLNDPATTVALLKLDAVVGLKGFF